MTNGEKIRALDNGELAEVLLKLSGDDCPPWDVIRCKHDRMTCADCWFNWLESDGTGWSYLEDNK